MFAPRDARILRPYPEELPWDLLLDADPSRERVEAYVSDTLTRIAKHDDAVIGVYALRRHDATHFELMNIAVARAFRGTGLGRRLLGHAIGLAESKGARIIDVGRCGSGTAELRFFQRAGFTTVSDCADTLRLTLTPE